MSTIYMGSMDDRVYRYPWPFFKNKILIKSYLNSIIQNTVIGHKSAINDGYLLANPILRDSLLKEDSLFRDMLCTGEIVIPGRQKSFSELIDEQTKNGIKTFGEIPKHIINQLSQVDNELSHFGARVSGPKSMDVWIGFYDLMKTLRNRPIEDLGIGNLIVSDYDYKLALDSFFDIPYDSKPPSRTQWESVLTELSKKHAGQGGFTAGKHTKMALMNLGNEAYHYNFSKKFSESSGLRIDIETINTPAFSHLLDEGRMDISTMIEDLPLIQIPKFNSLLGRGSMEELLDHDTDVGRARFEFTTSLREFEKNADDNTMKELKYKANVYNLLLNQRFGKPQSVNDFADSANFVLSVFTGYGAFVIDPSGVSTTIATGLLAWVMPWVGSRVLTNKFVTERPEEIDFKKYSIASTKLKGT